MEIKEKQLAYAFFNSCRVDFKYKNEDETRTLYTVNELKYNDDDEILIGGCTSSTGLYKQFFVENMNSVRLYKVIDYTEL
jgi:hypothetical protein